MYVVKPDNTVEVRTVTVDATQGDVVALDSGVMPGEMLVTDGLDKLQAGTKVIVQVAAKATPANPTAASAAPANPTAADPKAATAPAAKATVRAAPSEPVSSVHSATGRNVATDGRHPARGPRGVPAVAGIGAAGGGLPDDRGPHVLPGASPDVMASSVTSPLERQFGQVPGLNQMTSNSSFGSSVITLQFVLSLNIDVAEQEVQAAINAASTYLPADLPNPPIYSKTNPADAPILTLAFTSTALPLTQVEDLADTRLAQKMSQVIRRWTGQHQRRAEAGGARPGQPDRAGLVRLSLEDLRSAIAGATSTRPRGTSTARSRLTRSAPTTSCLRARPIGRWSWPTITVRRCGCRTSRT